MLRVERDAVGFLREELWQIGELSLTSQGPAQPVASDSPPTERPGHVRVNERSLLPRKEVIQPHLPVQLPCYDFVPVTGPTLGACLLRRG